MARPHERMAAGDLSARWAADEVRSSPSRPTDACALRTMSRTRGEAARSRSRWAVLPVLAVLAVSCRHAPASAGTGVVEPARLSEEDRAAYQRLQAAQQADPAGEELDGIAREILAAQGDEDLRIAALSALAHNAWLRGGDSTVIQSASEALALLDDGSRATDTGRDLQRLLALAHARSGDPMVALQLLDELDANAKIGTLELRGARAAAWDRTDKPAQALKAFALWRELLPEGSASAAYCEHRIANLRTSVSATALAALAKGMRASVAVDCLARVIEKSSPAEGPIWLAACSPPRLRVGVALPRSGTLAGLADPQLAAVAAASAVLSARVGFDLIFQDAGSTPELASEAVRELKRRGAAIVVGPVGAPNVAAAAKVGVPLQVPGEASKGAEGSGATLEARVDALIDYAKAQGRRSLVVLVPNNPYGERVRAAAKTRADKQGLTFSVAAYEASTTSFAPVLAGVEAAWKDSKAEGSVAILVGDAMPRVDLIARQLRRSGKVLDASALLMLSTAEGFSSQDVGPGHEALQGVALSPAAVATEDDAAFVNAYFEREGKQPGDQALLVWQALARAVGVKKGPLVPALIRAQGGHIVPIAP